MSKKDRKNDMREDKAAKPAGETEETAAGAEPPAENDTPAAEPGQEAPAQKPESEEAVEAVVVSAEAEAAPDRAEAEAAEPGEEQYTTLCALTGQLAGKITQQIHTLKAKLDQCCIQLGRLAYRSAHGRSAAPEREEQAPAERKQALLAELGAEVARLQRKQVQDVMSQPTVHELIGKIRACEEGSDAPAPEEPAAQSQV